MLNCQFRVVSHLHTLHVGQIYEALLTRDHHSTPLLAKLLDWRYEELQVCTEVKMKIGNGFESGAKFIHRFLNGDSG